MARYLMLDASGKVLNAVEWDGRSLWSPPIDCTLQQTDQGNIGDTWNGAVFTAARPIPPAKTLEERVAALEAALPI